MYDERTNLGQQVSRDIREFFQERVYEHGDPAQHPARRSAEPRPARDPLRRRSRAAPKPTSRSRASCSRATPALPPARRSHTMVEKRPALGRGLSALIPDAPAAARIRERALDVDIDLLAPEQVPAAHARWTTRGSRSSRDRFEPNGIIQPIVVAQGGRRLRDHRRRAPLARVAARRPPQGSRRRPRHPRGPAARRRADREHPARGPEPDRRSARVSPARRRVPPHAGADRRCRRQGSLVDRELRCGC